MIALKSDAAAFKQANVLALHPSSKPLASNKHLDNQPFRELIVVQVL
ncbi:hypothetical protein [Methylophilus sp. Leaf416]|nr:hypothetical protein [Methylophilus sp. Leaf416]